MVEVKLVGFCVGFYDVFVLCVVFILVMMVN